MGRSYISFPKDKPGVVVECCTCPEKEQIPTKGSVDIKLEQGNPVSIVKHWCANCGLYFSTRDQDKYFPAPFWVDNRPPATESVEDE
jgi:hypothetical protein